MVFLAEVAIDNRLKCARCGRPEPTTWHMEWCGLNTGTVGRYCPDCAGILEAHGQGRRLPNHPLFREAPAIVKEVEHLLGEWRKPVSTWRNFPGAVHQLMWAVAKVKPPQERAKRQRRVLES